MDEGTSTTTTEAPEGAQPITFKGREILTYLPNEAQIAVIARLSLWDKNVGQDSMEKLRRGINRVGALLAGLMVHQEDWDWIEDGMAARTIDWAEVLDIFDLIGDAHGLKNRAARRAKTTSRARRG